MAKVVSRINVELRAEQRKLQRDLKRTERQLKRQLNSIVKSIDQSVNRAIKVGITSAVAGVTAAVGGMAVAFNSARQKIDDVTKAAERLQIGANTLQTLQLAADRAGVSASALERSIAALNNRLGEATAGTGQAVAAFAELGLDAQALAAQSFEERLIAIDSALGRVSNATRRAALREDIFSQSSRQAANLLGTGQLGVQLGSAGSFLDRVGARLTGEQRDAVAGLNDSLKDLQIAFTAFADQITAKIAPDIQTIVESLVKMIAELNAEDVHFQFQNTLSATADKFKTMTSSIDRVESAIKRTTSALGGFLKILDWVTLLLPLGLGGAAAAKGYPAARALYSGQVSARLARRREIRAGSWDRTDIFDETNQIRREIEDGIIAGNKAVLPFFEAGAMANLATASLLTRYGAKKFIEELGATVGTSPAKAGVGGPAVQLPKHIEDKVFPPTILPESMMKRIRALPEDNFGGALFRNAPRAGLLDQMHSGIASAMGPEDLSGRINAMFAQMASQRDNLKKAVEEEVETFENANTNLDALISNYDPFITQLERSKMEIAEIKKGFEELPDSIKTPELHTKMDTLVGNMQQSAMLATDAWQSFASSVDGAISEMIRTGRLNFKNFVAGMLADLAIVTARQIWLPFLAQAVGGIAGAFGGGQTGAISQAPNAFDPNLPMMAEGGRFKMGKPFIVGEEGPEMILPDSSGMVVSNNDMNKMGTTQVFNFAGGVDQASLSRQLHELRVLAQEDSLKNAKNNPAYRQEFQAEF